MTWMLPFISLCCEYTPIASLWPMLSPGVTQWNEPPSFTYLLPLLNTSISCLHLNLLVLLPPEHSSVFKYSIANCVWQIELPGLWQDFSCVRPTGQTQLWGVRRHLFWTLGSGEMWSMEKKEAAKGWVWGLTETPSSATQGHSPHLIWPPAS